MQPPSLPPPSSPRGNPTPTPGTIFPPPNLWQAPFCSLAQSEVPFWKFRIHGATGHVAWGSQCSPGSPASQIPSYTYWSPPELATWGAPAEPTRAAGPAGGRVVSVPGPPPELPDCSTGSAGEGPSLGNFGHVPASGFAWRTLPTEVKTDILRVINGHSLCLLTLWLLGEEVAQGRGSGFFHDSALFSRVASATSLRKGSGRGVTRGGQGAGLHAGPAVTVTGWGILWAGPVGRDFSGVRSELVLASYTGGRGRQLSGSEWHLRGLERRRDG